LLKNPLDVALIRQAARGTARKFLRHWRSRVVADEHLWELFRAVARGDETAWPAMPAAICRRTSATVSSASFCAWTWTLYEYSAAMDQRHRDVGVRGRAVQQAYRGNPGCSAASTCPSPTSR
jgi:hypothetical protein